MRGDHNLVEPVIPARAKFGRTATEVWRNILSYGPQEAVNVTTEPSKPASDGTAATEVLHARNSPEVIGRREIFPG